MVNSLNFFLFSMMAVSLQALVVATVFVVIEELADLFFQITWQVRVLQ